MWCMRVYSSVVCEGVLKVSWYCSPRFLEDLEEGVFIQQTVENVLLNEDGKQLLVSTAVTAHCIDTHTYLTLPVVRVRVCTCMV